MKDGFTFDDEQDFDLVGEYFTDKHSLLQFAGLYKYWNSVSIDEEWHEFIPDILQEIDSYTVFRICLALRSAGLEMPFTFPAELDFDYNDIYAEDELADEFSGDMPPGVPHSDEKHEILQQHPLPKVLHDWATSYMIHLDYYAVHVEQNSILREACNTHTKLSDALNEIDECLLDLSLSKINGTKHPILSSFPRFQSEIQEEAKRIIEGIQDV